MNSALFKLNFKDLGKGLVIAVLVVVIGAVQQALQSHGFDFASYDWGSILDMAWKAAAAYLGKNLFSDTEGKFLGRVG